MAGTRYSVSLLFNANKGYDRQVIEGIGEYFQISGCDWDVFLEEDFRCQRESIKNWHGNGVIADMDDPEIVDLTRDLQSLVVGVGGSYKNHKDYPDAPYVATDNLSIIKTAYKHLRKKGIESFAYYGLPQNSYTKWAKEREDAFQTLLEADGYSAYIYSGMQTSPRNWEVAMSCLDDWLQKLPKPVGIIAVNDSRARHLLQACERLALVVPDEVSIIGIDNEDITRFLTKTPLSSVAQGTKQMGYEAAKLLHQKLQRKKVTRQRILVPPLGVVERLSTDYKSLRDNLVIQAVHFIHRNACNGIKVKQVQEFVGVSRSNLDKRFKSEMGHSIHTEIKKTKLEKALVLLGETELPIAEISRRCGYPTIQYMYSIFKRFVQKTPHDYRAQKIEERLNAKGASTL